MFLRCLSLFHLPPIGPAFIFFPFSTCHTETDHAVYLGLAESQNSLTNPQFQQEQPPTTAPPAFPTVVILESTPKPTPPDTPARGLSPSETQRSPFLYQSLSPLHALAVVTPEQQSAISSLNSSQQSSSSARAAAVIESKASSMALPPAPAVPAFGRGDEPPYSHGGTETSSSGRDLNLHPTSATISQNLVPAVEMHPTSANNETAATSAHPSRMFFLQRDSSSLSPDSNSRSGSHSRSPDSRSPDARVARVAHGGSSISPDPRNGESSAAAAGKTEGGENSRALMSGLEAKEEALLTRNGNVASESKHATVDAAAITRESRKGMAESVHQQPLPPAAVEQTNMSILPAATGIASSSSSSHTHPSGPQRLIMSRKKGGYRPHLGRGVDRPSSRNSNRGSVGSRGSASGHSASNQRHGATMGRTGGAGSIEANAGSVSASGMGSVSTSASSNIIMKRHARVHSPLRTAAVADNVADSTAAPRQRLASGSGQSQGHHHGQPHVSPLAVLPEPLRMEVLERQVMQSAMKSQSDGRKISLQSDSEEDYTDDDEADDSEDDEIVVVQKDKGKSNAKVEEDDGSSWSDEDDEEVTISKKRPQVQQRHSGAAQPPSRRNSRDLDHLIGSAGSGRVNERQGARVEANHTKQLPHVKSKGKIHHYHHPHGHGQHEHVPQRGGSPPPPRPAVTRKASAGHTRGAPSQDGPLAQAAREALRQRDMFTPLPRETYSSTNLVREKSRTSLSRGGKPSNLTMLLNPDPQWFPQNHPYRQEVHPMDQKLSRSMEELYARGGTRSGMKSPRAGVGLGFGGLKMTTTAQPSPRTQPPTPVAAPAPAAAVPPPVAKSTSPQPSTSRRTPTMSKSPPTASAPTKLRPSKSALSIPVVLGVTASSTPRDEKQADMLEMSLRQMGPQRQRVPRQLPAPAASVEKSSVEQSKLTETPSARPSSRLPAKPSDIEFSDTEDEAPTSPAPKVAGSSGRSLAKEHLEAVIGGKPKAGMSASRNVVASPDAVPKDPRENDPTSVRSLLVFYDYLLNSALQYRPPAPPSSPSVYNPYEAKRAQGHLPHTPTPPSNKRSPVTRAPRIRPHSSHGQPTAPVISPPATQPSAAPQRERRQPATSQPPIPVTTAPLQPAGVPWPYNLPYPAPVQSPRTTRLNMLASEVPDDLRKDLLWERKTNRIAPLLDNRTVVNPLTQRRNAPNLRPMTNMNNGESEEESEQARLEREAKERYDKMRTQTWNGVIYQRPVW